MSHFVHTPSITTDIGSDGKPLPIEEDRPSGADSEHKQSAKTINAMGQRKKRDEKRRKKMAKEYDEAVTTRNTISNICNSNIAVENKIKSTIGANEMLDDVLAASLDEAKVATFLARTSAELKDFIHVRKFTDGKFHQSRLTGSDGKLNKTQYVGQSAESIEQNSNEESPCLVWLAWSIRSQPIVLEIPPERVNYLCQHSLL